MQLVGTISLLLLAASARADVETRPLATAITSLTSNSGVDVSLKALAPGQTNSTITVEAPTGQLVLVKTEVVGNALTVTLDPAAPATTNADKMKVTILLPATNLAEVNSQGAGDLDIDGFVVPKLAIAVSGAGDVEFEGQADALTLKMTGAGDVELDGEDGAIATSLAVESTGSGKVNAGEFKAKTVDLKLAGSGDASVFATEAVTVAASGSGDVDIKGNPATRNVDAKGSGEVTFKRLRA